MKKLSLSVVIMLFTVFMSACGAETTENIEQVTSVKIQKDGSIIGTIIEPFDKEYYDINSLENMIKTDIEKFYKDYPSTSIVLENCSIIDETSNVKVVMNYDSAKTYSEFNNEVLFYGTVLEAFEAGYDLDTTLNSTDLKNEKTLTKSDILDMSTSSIVIIGEPIQVNTNTNVLYISDGMELVGKKTANNNKQGIGMLIVK